MNRDEAIEIIVQAREGPPPGSVEHRDLMAFLEKSPECRALYEQQQALWDELDRWQPVDPSLGFDRRLFEKLEADVPWWRRVLMDWKPGFAVGLASLLIAATAVLYQAPRQAPVPGAVATVGPSPDTQYFRQLDSALDDLEMLAEFDVLPLAAGSEDKS